MTPAQSEKTERSRWAGLWLVQLGVLLMTFGIGGFLGFIVGRTPVFAAVPPRSYVADRAERRANDAEYYARRTIVGISRVERCSH